MKLSISSLSFFLCIAYCLPPMVSNAQQVSAGGGHTAFLCPDNYAHGWGRNDVAQIGDSSTTNKSVPSQTLGGHRFTQIATGLDHTYALKSDGQVYGWGRAAEGQLGWWFAGPIHLYRTAPTVWRNTSGIDAVKLADTRGHFSMAMRDDSTLYAWGENIYGQLGDGTTSNRENYVAISSAGKITDLVGGFDHALVIKADSTLMSTGYNKSGQLGTGGTAPRTSYGVVDSIEQVIAIEAGSFFSVALKADGTVWTWGINGRGQLGNGSTKSHYYPRQIQGLSNITAIAAGEQHVLALKSDGTVLAWGGNDYGQLGDSSFSNSLIPIVVKRLIGVVMIEAGGHHSVAVTTSNVVVSWGKSNSGQIGNCDTLSSNATFDTTQLKCMYCPDIVVNQFGSNSNFYDADFTDSSASACEYLWDFGDGNTSFLASPSHTYAMSGKYKVCQYLSNSCNQDSICDSITIACPMPVSSFSHSGVSTTITFNNMSTNVTSGYLWSFGDGGQDTLQNPVHTYATAGNYKVCLISYNLCGSDTLCENFNVNCTQAIPGFSFNANGLDVQFTDASDSSESVSWDFDDGKTDTAWSPLHSYTIAGVYNVCQTVSSDCMDSTLCQEVNVSVLGINPQTKDHFTIHPIPARDQIQIQTSFSRGKLLIFNILGDMMLETSFSRNNIQIQLNEFEAGIYLLQLQSGDAIQSKKFLIDE